VRERDFGGPHGMLERVWVIGRSRECQVRVDDPMVSGNHCELRWTEHGWLLKHLGSTNGTYVNI